MSDFLEFLGVIAIALCGIFLMFVTMVLCTPLGWLAMFLVWFFGWRTA